MTCPIWPEHPAREARLVSETGTPITAKRVECPVCGTFDIGDITAAMMKERTEEERWRLSWATRQASEQGSVLRLVKEDTRRAIESVAEPSPPDKLDILLKLLVSRNTSFGEQVRFDYHTDWPLFCARGTAEASRIALGLAKMGLVEMPAADPSAFVVTTMGWARFAALPTAPGSASTAAFVAMWFDKAMTPAYDDGFEPTLRALGYDPIRVDREQYLGKVDDFIVASIRKSALLVADFTGHRGGVYFETGFAMGLGIPVVFTCREDQIEEAHFDTRQYNHIVWTTPADLAAKLRARIEATIPTRPKTRG